MADSGFGVAITFSSSFCAQITNVEWSGISRKAIDTTNSATTNGAATFIPSDIEDYGELKVDLQFNPNDAPPISGAAETVTVTFPTPAGGSTPATWAASGFLTDFQVGVPIDDVMTATATIKFSAIVTFTDST
jgi:hypothetical protein